VQRALTIGAHGRTFDRLVDAADDVEDRRELAAARADDDYVPWDEVKVALGLW